MVGGLFPAVYSDLTDGECVYFNYIDGRTLSYTIRGNSNITSSDLYVFGTIRINSVRAIKSGKNNLLADLEKNASCTHEVFLKESLQYK